VEAGEFCELFLGEVPFGSELTDAIAERFDEGLIQHRGSTIRIVCRRSTYNPYHRFAMRVTVSGVRIGRRGSRSRPGSFVSRRGWWVGSRRFAVTVSSSGNASEPGL
jgi:hypothetical protein